MTESLPRPAVNILLVDDEPANLLSLAAALDGIGSNLVEVRSGEEALRILLDRDFAAILLDIQLPGLSGFETAKLIRARERSRGTPIIFVTGFDDDPQFSVRDAYALGAVDYLVKPIVPEILRAKVLVFIDLFQRTRQAIRAELQARERLGEVLAAVNDMFLMLDSDLRYTYVNDKMVLASGIPRERIVGKLLTEVFPDAAGSLLERELRRVLDEQVSVHFEFYHAAYDRWFDNRACPSPDGLILVTTEITDVKKAEEARRHLAAIVESSYDAILSKDLSGVITSWNQGAERLLGYTADEVIGRHVSMLIPDGRTDDVALILDRIRRGERVEELETKRRRKDGTIVDVSLTVSPIRNAADQIVGASKIARDITRRKRAEDQLQLVTDSAPVLIAYCDAGSRFLFVNKGYADRFGLSRDQIVGRTIWEVIGREAYESIEPYVAEVLAGRPVEFEVEIPYRDLGRRWMHAAYVPDHDADGRVRGLVAAIVDVTKQKQAEEALTAAEHRFASFGQNLPGLTWIKDVEGRYIYANDAAVRAFGTPRERLYGKTDHEVFPSETAAQFTANDARAIDSGAGIQTVESLKHDDGVHHSVVSKFVIPGPRGEPALVGGIAIDITEEKRLEEELKNRVNQLAEADRRKDEFLAMLAHELRNPLAAIANAVELSRLADAGRDDSLTGREIIGRQVRHLTRLIDDLLDVSRITRGKIELKKQPLDASLAISGAVESVRPMIEARGQQLDLSLGAGLRVEADPTRLEQILVNLLSNAAKYTEPGGKIWLTVRNEGKEVRFTVRDTGAGIPPERVPEMFELFAQGDRSLARAEGGLGIGLTLVKRLAEMHGGGVSAKSAGLGCGSEFTVQLPAATKPIPAEPADAAEAKPQPGGSRILIIDDNADSTHSLSRLLRLLGHDVAAAHSGPEGLEIARSFRPRFVLLDIGLPGMSGYEVAQRLKGDPELREVVIIGVSGYGQEDDKRRSRAAGFDHHLVKPVDYNTLLSLVSTPS
jgi:PAS domain S-box-containing protein